mgnify:CR=1 FL=1
MLYLDTHVVVWLAAGLIDKLSHAAKIAIEEAEELVYSPVVALELKYLHETGRIKQPPDRVLAGLEGSIGLKSRDLMLGPLIASASRLEWTRDLFDRLIVVIESVNSWQGIAVMRASRFV